MPISQRIESTIENWRTRWGEALKNFLAAVITWGIELLLDIVGKLAAGRMKPMIDKIEESGKVPDWLLPILREIKEPTGQLAGMLLGTTAGAATGGLISSTIGPYLYPLQLTGQEEVRATLLDPMIIANAILRYPELKGSLLNELADAGYKDWKMDIFQELIHILLSEGHLRGLYLRGEITRERVADELVKQGWDRGRITEAMKLWEIIPPLADMVRFADFSAFDPDVIAKWREFYDAPDWIRKPFSLLGVTGEWANRYWFSHWIQPGRFELGELHRREKISDDDVKLAYRTMGYSAFWQDLLLELVKAVPTRVDVRRWWDMRTIDEARLREIYHAQGYYGKDLDDYVLWTKVYVAFPDLIARFKNGWLSEDDVRSQLTDLGMPADRVEEMMQTKIKPDKPERTSKERDLTKTDIYRGVKKEVISWSEGRELLQDMGYDEAEAEYILTINVGAAGGSPETFAEFKQWTQLYRKAQGLEAKVLPDELIEASKAVTEAETALREAQEKDLKEAKLEPYLKAKNDAVYRYRQLLTKWQEETKTS